MIKFFRKIRQRLLTENKFSKYLMYAFGEIILVVIGILIALQINNWNSQNKVEQREIGYIKSLIEDISSDIIQSDEIIKELSNTEAGLEELLLELSNENIYNDSNNAYQLWINNFGIPDFISNNRTLELLKNSGGFELITKNQAIDAILKYEQAIKLFQNQDEMMAIAMVNGHPYSRSFDVIKLSNPSENQLPIPLLSKDKQALNEMYTNRLLWRYGLLSLKLLVQDIQKTGKETILILKSNYNL